MNLTVKKLSQRMMGAGALALTAALTLSPMDEAKALTIVLDFSSTSTSIFSETTGAFNFSTYGFTTLNSTQQVQNATLGAVQDNFLNYVTNAQDPLSPLLTGQELDIDFEIGTFGTGPTNGDTEWWNFKIGDGLVGINATNPNIFEQSCLSCVRTSSGTANSFNEANGATVASIFTDHIDAIAFLAGNDDQLINLIAGKISHSIGHTLSLTHTGAQNANPGTSLWGVMGNGATSMPHSQRFLDREFTYNHFNQLIGSVGIRDVVTDTVPEPGTLALLGLGLAVIGFRRRKAK